MGEKITPARGTADLSRAKALKEALHRGTRTLSVPAKVPSLSAGPSGHPAGFQKEYLEQLIECTPEAISILDAELSITRVNSEFARIFGYNSEAALGRRLDSLIIPPDRHAETRWLVEMLAKGQKVVLETKRQRKDGSLVDVLFSAAPVVVEGKQVGAYVLYRDITEQ